MNSKKGMNQPLNSAQLLWIKAKLEEKYGETVVVGTQDNCPHTMEHELHRFAADFRVVNVDADLVFEFLDKLLEGCCGVHHLGKHVHVDLRPAKWRRW